MTASVALQLAMALLPSIQHGVEQFIVWMESLRAAAKQSGEWTPEQDEAFRQSIMNKTGNPAYQPD